MKIFEGQLFRDTEAIGHMDPFVEVEYLGKKIRTQIL